jgi:hypothetical protein
VTSQRSAISGTNQESGKAPRKTLKGKKGRKKESKKERKKERKRERNK